MRRLGDATELGFAANFKVVRAATKPLTAVTEGISGIIISYFKLSAGAWEAQAAHGRAIVLAGRPSERSRIMKRFKSVGMLVLAMVVGLVSVSAFGQEVNKTILLKRDTKIGGQVLPKGEYDLRYVEGKDELVIAKGKKEVLTATYKIAKLDKAAAVTSVIYSQETDGSYQLKRIEFRGRDAALTFDNTVAKLANH